MNNNSDPLINWLLMSDFGDAPADGYNLQGTMPAIPVQNAAVPDPNLFYLLENNTLPSTYPPPPAPVSMPALETLTQGGPCGDDQQASAQAAVSKSSESASLSNASCSRSSGDEQQQQQQQQRQQQASTTKNKDATTERPSITFGTGRRSEDDDEYLSESQLKMMTSKERRQLRNKISARKFRNRRKEYISMLEAEVQKQKAENSQLRLEVIWIRTTADRLQKENDRLRLELVLCREGIRPRRPSQNNEQQQQNQSEPKPSQSSSQEQQSSQSCQQPPSTAPSQEQQQQQQQRYIQHAMPYGCQSYIPVAPVVPSTMPGYAITQGMARPASLSPPSYGNSSFHSYLPTSDSSTISSNSNPSPPEFSDSWELVFPSSESQHQQQTYLSHAVMPDWDLNRILKKEREIGTPANELFYKYPLLAPALMSIVLGHTMTMTAQDLVASAKLLVPPPPSNNITDRFSINDLLIGPKLTRRPSNGVTGKEIQSMWEAHQKRLDTEQQEEDDDGFDSLEEWKADGDQQIVTFDRRLPENCPLLWIQRQFCRFVYEYVIARYPHLEPQCQMFLPICDKYRRSLMVSSS